MSVSAPRRPIVETSGARLVFDGDGDAGLFGKDIADFFCKLQPLSELIQTRAVSAGWWYGCYTQARAAASAH
jgi:hypothetical protein